MGLKLEVEANALGRFQVALRFALVIGDLLFATIITVVIIAIIIFDVIIIIAYLIKQYSVITGPSSSQRLNCASSTSSLLFINVIASHCRSPHCIRRICVTRFCCA